MTLCACHARVPAWQERALARWEHDGSFEAELFEMPLPLRPLAAALLMYAVTAALCAFGAASAWGALLSSYNV